MTGHFFTFCMLRHFSADGQVYRAFNHLIAASMGRLLLVPIHLVSGRCDEVIDGCPVPWEEVHAVLEYPVSHPVDQFRPHAWSDELQKIEVLGINAADCGIDRIAPMVKGEEKVLRLVHPCGVRYAVVMG